MTVTDTDAPSSTLTRPVEDLPDEDLLARWRHSATVIATTATGADVDGEAGTEVTTGAPGDEAPRRRRAVRGLLSHLTPARTLVSLVLIAALAAAGWFAYRDRTSGSALADQTAAAHAASADAVALATYDYNHLDQFFADVKSFSTPGFGAKFDQGAQSLVKVLTQYKATSTGKLASYGVKSATGNRVTVLVVVDQTVANSASKTPSAQTEAFEYTMVHQHGRWLLDVAGSVH